MDLELQEYAWAWDYQAQEAWIVVLRTTPIVASAGLTTAETSRRVMTLQQITLAWMCIEFGIAAFSAWRANSMALLAFGSDSLVELLSAVIVTLQFTAQFRIRQRTAARIARILLLVLAAMIAVLSIGALVTGVEPQPSLGGIAVSLAALVIMPSLSRAKRELARKTSDEALAADAIQSAMCAYLAAITLIGLLVNALFHIHWVDPIAALVATPILFIEARRSGRGNSCGCC